jgi:hypothetical protein
LLDGASASAALDLALSALIQSHNETLQQPNSPTQLEKKLQGTGTQQQPNDLKRIFSVIDDMFVSGVASDSSSASAAPSSDISESVNSSLPSLEALSQVHEEFIKILASTAAGVELSGPTSSSPQHVQQEHHQQASQQQQLIESLVMNPLFLQLFQQTALEPSTGDNIASSSPTLTPPSAPGSASPGALLSTSPSSPLGHHDQVSSPSHSRSTFQLHSTPDALRHPCATTQAQIQAISTDAIPFIKSEADLLDLSHLLSTCMPMDLCSPSHEDGLPSTSDSHSPLLSSASASGCVSLGHLEMEDIFGILAAAAAVGGDGSGLNLNNLNLAGAFGGVAAAAAAAAAVATDETENGFELGLL